MSTPHTARKRTQVETALIAPDWLDRWRARVRAVFHSQKTDQRGIHGSDLEFLHPSTSLSGTSSTVPRVPAHTGCSDGEGKVSGCVR